MPIILSGNTILYTPIDNNSRWLSTGVIEDDNFAICDTINVLKQIQFNINPVTTGQGTLTIQCDISGDQTINLATLSTGNAFGVIQTDSGTFPTADTLSDTLFIIGDGVFTTVSGDASSDTVSINTLYTPEDLANKSTDFTTLNNTLYPTTLAVSNFLGTYLSGNNIFMFSDTASDIAGYESAPELSAYTAGGLALKNTTVTTAETLLEEFATDLGYPNANAIPVGVVSFHYETEKVSGSNNYRTRAKLYKRDSGGTETLLLTSDNSTETSSNTAVQQTVTALNSSIIYLNLTDRLVCKVYAEMLSSSATIILRYDDNTDARFSIPTTGVGPNSGDVTLAAIGSSPNANAATLTGQVLNLEPADASFGGVVTTTTQTFAGDKTFTGIVAHSLGSATLPAIVPTGDVDTGVWSSGSNSWSVSTTATERIRIGVNNSGFINIHGNFTSQTYGMLLNGMAANVPTLGLRLANSQSVNLVDLVTYAGSVFGSITKDGFHNMPLGAVTTPTYSFIGDTNTGIYSSAADTLNLTTGGTERLRLLSGGVINTGGNYTDTTAGFQMTALGTTKPILHLKHIASGTSDFILCKDSSSVTKMYVNYTGKVAAKDGAYNDTSYAFVGSSKTGMYYAGSESIGFSCSNTKMLTIDINGNLRAYSLHNNATANGDSNNQDIRSGDSYGSTITNEDKCSGVTFDRMQWLRVGNVVTVSGYGTIASTDGSSDYSFEMSIPVSSNFSADYQCAGMCTIYQATKPLTHAVIFAETTNNTAKVTGFEENGLSDAVIAVHFTYVVIDG